MKKMSQKEIKGYTILGFVKNIVYDDTSTGSCGSQMKIVSIDSGKDYSIYCPYFCPVKRDDVIKGYCDKDMKGNLYFVIEPVAEPNTSKDSIKTSFIIPLKKTHFGEKSAEKLYNHFENMAKDKIANNAYDNKDTILRNRNSLCHATMEIISSLAERYEISEDALDPLIYAGLNKQQAEKLLVWWRKNVTIRRLILLGLTKKEIHACVTRKWDLSKLYYQLITNPYLVIDVPMDICKLICQKYHLIFSADMISAAQLVRFIDTEASRRKWACFPLYRLKNMYKDYGKLEAILEKDFGCIIRNNSFYLEHHKQTEDILCKFLTPKETDEVTYLSERSKLKLTAEQQEALSMALNSNVSVITGGAGTGKSTLICSIAEELDLRKITYVITAYTGKAVARLKQIFNREDVLIMTLHMLMAKVKVIKKMVKYIIVDESSMIPNQLFSLVLSQLEGINPENDWVHNFAKRTLPLSIIIVGDPNQVQPIDWGDFFNQIQNTGLPHKHLTTDHRRSRHSCLYDNVDAIANTKNKLDIEFKWGNDCNFIQGDIPEVISTFSSLLENGYDHKEITVISPFNESVTTLNPKIRDCIMGRPDMEIETITDAWNITWYKGSRVMCNTNRYDVGIMNGEEGVITKISKNTGHVFVTFLNHDEIAIPTHLPMMKELDEETENDNMLSTRCIELCWAITIMKSQGSEWKAVILFLPPRSFIGSFVNWKLLYTGLSRAKDNLIIISNNYQNVLKILTNEPIRRHDNLSVRIKSLMPAPAAPAVPATETKETYEIIDEYDEDNVIEIPF